MRIFLAEQDAELAASLTEILEQSSFQVDWSNDGVLAQRILSLEEFDVAVLNIDLPGKSGRDILFHLKVSGNNIPVLMLSTRRLVDDLTACLNEGADDFVITPVFPGELIARLQAILRRAHRADRLLIKRGPLVYDTKTRIFQLEGTALKLTPREHALLLALIQRAGQTISKKVLFDLVFGPGDEAHVEAIEVIIWRLRKRLSETSARIVNMRGFGYRLEFAEEDQPSPPPSKKQ